MFASQLKSGDVFRIVGENNALKCVDDDRPAGWERAAGTVYLNLSNGMYGGLGPYVEVEIVDDAKGGSLVRDWASGDIDSGLGIGGVGSDDYNIGTEYAPSVNRFNGAGKCSWGGTRYDEECARCGCVTAICNDCELCDSCHD